MKKNILKAAAAALVMTICFISCDDSQKPEEVVGDVEMVDYMLGEAKEIRIPLTYSEDSAPFELKEYDMPDMGAKQPKCGSLIYDSIYPDEYYDQPCNGCIQNYTIGGDYIYLYVNYDGYCHNGHENAIMSYNMQTAELKELYVHSDAEISENILSLAAVGDKLYICVTISDISGFENKRSIYEINTATGEKKTIYEDASVYLADLCVYDGKLYFYYDDYKTNADGEQTVSYFLKSYAPETGEWTFESDAIFPDVNETIFYGVDPFHAVPFYFGEVFCSSSYNSESKTTKIVADKYFSLETKHRSVRLVGADQNSVKWISKVDYGTYVELYLNSFNREAMEICSVKLDRQDEEVVSVGEGCFVLSGNSVLHYLLPELGLAFPITETGIYKNLRQNNGVVSFAEYADNSLTEDGIVVVSHRLDKIYVIDTNEQAE